MGEVRATRGTRADGEDLADRGRVADARQQPRPGRRRAPGGTRRLRRHRQGGAGLAQLPARSRPRSRTCAADETLLVQSGRPVGILRTHEWAPRVLIANSNLVPDWANWDEFRRLEAAGLTMYGQMTAGSWIYIGTQGILQGTYETFAAVAEKRFGGTLAGTVTLTAGLGGMGGAQPLAITMNGGVALVVECDPTPDRAPGRAGLPRRRRREPRRRDLEGRGRPRPSARRSRSACSATRPRCCPT